MPIYAVCPAGQDRRAGLATETWERRPRGGAVQERHSLALVRGQHPAAHCSSWETNDERGGAHCLKAYVGNFNLHTCPKVKRLKL